MRFSQRQGFRTFVHTLNPPPWSPSQITDFGALSQLSPPCFSGPMNPLPAAALPRPQSSAGSVGNTAPTSTAASPTGVKGKRSRKRESSSASEQDEYEGSFGDKRRQPGVKRACNECRQQKVGLALVVRREGYTADESTISYGAMLLRNRCTRHAHDVSA